MPNTLQAFLAGATQKAADDLIAALNRLPDDKRNWNPMGEARTALDMVAECAILNGETAQLIQTRKFNEGFDLADLARQKAELAQDQDALLALLKENTGKVIAALRACPESDLGEQVSMPFGPLTFAQIISYPYWNMSYHEGQINYIASMLGCLK